MEFLTNEPGLQFYSENFLNRAQGKTGHTCEKRGGLPVERAVIGGSQGFNASGLPRTRPRPDRSFE